MPLQFGRRVISRLLGAPEREDWKQCAQPKNVEAEYCTSMKQTFKAFDFTLM